MIKKEDALSKGDQGEADLKTWFDQQALAFVHISQSHETFATLFKDDVKRPDFLLLFDSIGLIAIDAKNKSIYKKAIRGTTIEKSEITKHTSKYGWVSLDDEATETKKSLAFERIFRMPFWYAFLDDSGEDGIWYWISALKALEVGVRVVNRKSKADFLNISLDDCVCIKSGEDLGKLYTQRMPSYKAQE